MKKDNPQTEIELERKMKFAKLMDNISYKIGKLNDFILSETVKLNWINPKIHTDYSKVKKGIFKFSIELKAELKDGKIMNEDPNNIDLKIEMDRDKNLKQYRSIKDDLEKTHLNKWALISNGELQCIKDSRNEIIEEIKKRNLTETPNYLFQIGKKQVRHRFGLR